MPDQEEWYLHPIELGYYTYTDLKSGSILVEDIAEINDMMRVNAENRWRMRDPS